MKALKKIAVMTSGGDAPGMNAALRGVVRAALNRGWEVFGIRNAYRGLAEGAGSILPLDWLDVSWSFREGGTVLGSARFPEIAGDTLKSKELKQQALLNLKTLNITGLVVIGGDGSLTGAQGLFMFLQNSRWASPELRDMELSVVAIPGSIDNDIPFTDMSIGVDTTLNTIIECIDKLRDTATSHGRVSIVEVMGRLRGYLAVMSGLATGADRVFIREERISQNELNSMLQVLRDSFVHGQKAGIIIRSEGAEFSTGFLKETIANLLEPKREVRETVLGHLQRGGNPTAFERIMAARMGVKAVQLLEAGLPEPHMIGLTHNRLESVPLSRVLEKLSMPEFKNQLSPNTRNALHLCQQLEDPPQGNTSTGVRVAVITDGGNVSGMNIAVRAIARLAINEGLQAVGIKGGFSGLLRGRENILRLDWSMLELKGIVRWAGTLLGVSSDGFPDAIEHAAQLRQQVNKLDIKGLLVIGGSTAYQYADRVAGVLQIPVVGIPAALCCNLLGTDLVVGIDTALNDFLKGIDRAVDAANVQKKIYIIHITGDYCNCLVKLAALAGGSEAVIVDQGGDLQSFQALVREKIQGLKHIIAAGKNSATVICFARQTDQADATLKEIKRSIIDSGITRETSVIALETTLGGIVPTAFDRILAQRLAEKALAVLQNKMQEHEHAFHMVGIKGRQIVATSYQDIKQNGIRTCPDALVSELDQCIDLMSVPGAGCAGLGGTIAWVDTGNADQWQGRWTCRQCGHQQDVLFNPRNLCVIYCAREACPNYGYIRISRRL
jgi:6-phosphofructokinase 1